MGQTADQQFAGADVIFDGVALDGPTATGIERFRVLRYIKSSGPQLIQVDTGRRVQVDAGRRVFVFSTISITATPGETWRIYAKHLAAGLFRTDLCLGSRRLSVADAEPPAPQWLPTLTVAGRFGTRSLLENDDPTGQVSSASVRRGELLRFRFNFRPTSVTIQHRRSRYRRLPPQQAVTWRVLATGTYLVRLTAVWTKQDGSETVRFTSRFLIRLTARSRKNPRHGSRFRAIVKDMRNVTETHAGLPLQHVPPAIERLDPLWRRSF